MRSIASLAADKTIFEKSRITEDVLLKEGGAEAYTDIFVYDITLSEMQEKMTEMIASGQGSELRNFCDGAYVLVDENSLAKGPLTAVESIAIQELGVSYPAFYNTFSGVLRILRTHSSAVESKAGRLWRILRLTKSLSTISVRRLRH
ncbi:MAG: hypothetical protein IAA72_07230 [Spirochaetes bacterium]|uniref:Uncharacterized protein n=1 Tax=Candidatus Ornithospirochaeta stercoravium TaxID=2840897 RepID=A0A9D9IBI0_9SPIO|nr:hypothetical protein [Candidatus Ornithospirochaeta stercoravium]